tara:strand:- start:291 stop:533 length:243 start_codon:yes stop_codon:yes gene_type:complete
MQLIEFLPDYSTWDDWNGQLVHYYGEQQFPILPEEQWREVAKAVTVNPVFDKFSIPDPENFINWQDWALSLIQNVNGDGA